MWARAGEVGALVRLNVWSLEGNVLEVLFGSSTGWTGAEAFFFFGFGTAIMVFQLSMVTVTLPLVKFFFASFCT
jgi:hypothetical protein